MGTITSKSVLQDRPVSDCREYIIYLETDITVKATSFKQAEVYAKQFTKIDTVSPLVKIDETRIVTSERKPRGIGLNSR